jgi:hypothetical protein
MKKNYNENNYKTSKDVEERVQIAQETCNCEEELEAAIERSKQKLKSSTPPSGYTKIDEKITTRIYKIPDNKYVNEHNIIEEEKYFENSDIRKTGYDYQNNQDNYNNIYNTERKANKYSSNYNYNNTDYYNKNANFKLEYVSSVNPRKMKYVENYENNYNYNNKTPKTFIKYEPYTQGRIENYYENNISKDGQYLVTISLSKIVNDPIPKSLSNNANNNYNYKKETKETIKKTYNNTNNNSNNSNYKKETRETIQKSYINNNNNNKNYKKENKETIQKSYNSVNSNYKKSIEKPIQKSYISNYNKEKIETKKANEKLKSIEEEKETNTKTLTKEEKFGHNYNFYERKENTNSAKVSQTHQRMREPIMIQKNQKSVKTQNTTYNNYNTNQPGKSYQTVVKSYKKEVIGDNNNNQNVINVTKYSVKASNLNNSKTDKKSKEIKTNYKISKNH